jgi:hypothetical protein
MLTHRPTINHIRPSGWLGRGFGIGSRPPGTLAASDSGPARETAAVMMVTQGLSKIVFLCALAVLTHAGPATAQSFLDAEELGFVHLVYLDMRNEIGDDCFASTRTLQSDVETILRDHDIIVTDIRRFSTNILSLRVLGSLADGTEVCTAAVEIELYRWVRIRSGNAVRAKAYGALTLVTAEKPDIFARLRQSVAAFITHLATEIQNIRAHSG